MKTLFNKIALTIMVLGLSCASAFAQQVKGTVKDPAGQSVIGAAVLVSGTAQGTVTDNDGKFVIAVPADGSLTVSSIGYVSQTVAVNGRSELLIVLEEDNLILDDVVVVGYGVQKKSVVTAAISSVTADKLKNQANTRIDNVLQGMTSGVLITQTSGAPDAGSQVRIRGVGSIHDSEPLYIVDGLAIGGGIDYLNPNDIERIEVLKDAASGAVYGARAANGVILVTTKKGQTGKARVSYDFSYGWQNPWRKPSVLNATEYAIMMNEGYLNNGEAPLYDDPYSFGKGTDWVTEVINKNAPVMKHDISVSGGSEKVNYAVSAGYLTRQGTVGGNFKRANYDRFTMRENTGFVFFDNSDSRTWLNRMEATTSISYAHINATGISTNTEYGSPLGSAMGMSPLLPVLATPEMEESYRTLYPAGFPHLVRNADGVAYSIADGAIYNEMKNPLADLTLPGTQYQTDKFIANGTVELQIWDNIKFKTSIGLDMAFWGNHGHSVEYFLNSKNYNYDTVTENITYDKDGKPTVNIKNNYASGASQEMNRSFRWQIENVLSYQKTFGKHTVSALLGQAAIRAYSSNVGASAKGLMYPYDFWKISVNNTVGQEKDGDRNGWGSWNSNVYSLASYFARISYNYDERYMIEATIRRDGSSNFGDNHKWGNFPSVSAGWNFKNESFLKDVRWLSMGKFRASWGINGNDAIGAFRYAVYMNSNNNYVFGSGAVSGETIQVGTKPSGLANPDVKWEQSRQADLGLDLGFFGNRLTATIDWYHKKTSGMLLDLPVPGYSGDSAPIGNLGDMVNTGVELEFGWRHQVGDFSYHASVNATYIRNKLTYLGDDATSLYGSSHKIGQLTRGLVGLPFPYFYGYEADGIFQNAAEIDAHRNAEGALLQPHAVPGDVRYLDLDGDGAITPEDRHMIGKGTPDWTFGLNLGFEVKGVDFNMLLQGQAGCQTFNVSRRTDLYYINLPKTILNRWTGEGSTNSAPRFTFDGGENENYRVSALWLEDSSFLRCRNMQLGYTLPVNITKKAAIQRLRFYVQAENLFTITKYTGNDPEVTGGNSAYGTEVGVDRGIYPQSRTFSIGLNLNF